jgi:hypothetical protein
MNGAIIVMSAFAAIWWMAGVAGRAAHRGRDGWRGCARPACPDPDGRHRRGCSLVVLMRRGLAKRRSTANLTAGFLPLAGG